jgi:hypothetical protein
MLVGSWGDIAVQNGFEVSLETATSLVCHLCEHSIGCFTPSVSAPPRERK